MSENEEDIKKRLAELKEQPKESRPPFSERVKGALKSFGQKIKIAASNGWAWFKPRAKSASKKAWAWTKARGHSAKEWIKAKYAAAKQWYKELKECKMILKEREETIEELIKQIELLEAAQEDSYSTDEIKIE